MGEESSVGIEQRQWGRQRRGRQCVLALALLGIAPALVGFDAASPETWLLDDADLYSVAARGDRVWAVGYWGTALRSVDRGTSWVASTTPTRETLYAVDFWDETRGWAVGASGEILRSTDGGASWTRQPVMIEDESGERRPLDTHLFGVAALSPSEAWAVGDMGVVLHVRDGANWEPVPIAEETYGDDEPLDRIFNGVHFADREHGWIVGEFGTILRTQDGGASWSGEREFVGAADDLYLYDVSALDAERVGAVGLAGTVLVTEDGGRSWVAERTGSSAPVYGLSWGNPSAAVVGDRGEIFTSSGIRRSWVLADRPPHFNWLRGVTDGGRGSLYAVGEKGIVLHSADTGRSWLQQRGSSPIPRSGVSVPEISGASDSGLSSERIPVQLEN